jgi:hypothetical protein
MFNRGEYFITFDLKSGYHHVDIHPDFWTYLGFSWSLGKKRVFYMFRVLPFGLSSACYVFTKVLRPLVKRWRDKGIRAIIYIDDGIVAAKSREQCLMDQQLVTSDLDLAGFILNISKLRLEPHQLGGWLGFIIDLCKGNFHVPEEKIDGIKSSIREAYVQSHVLVKCLASIVGKIISMTLAIGPVSRLRTRALYTAINSRRSWCDRVSLSQNAKEELEFWCRNINFLNGKPIWFNPGATRIVYSDASDSGYGGYVVELGPEVAHGQWSEAEALLSSTWRELKAVYLVLMSFAEKLAGHRVKWFTDNQGVMYIICAGSKKEHLQEGAIQIFNVCLSNNIKLEVEWIPRSENEYADVISRIIDYDDWSLNPQLFLFLDANWGTHTIDCFASPENAQLPRFHSWFWSPGSVAVNTFTVNWGEEVNWWVPPLHLVCHTISHALNCKAKGTLVVPMWKSAPFWP